MKAAEIMTHSVVTVPPSASIEEAIRLMAAHRISGIPVVTEDGVVVGIVTEGDLLRRTETGTDATRAGWLVRMLFPGRLAGEYVHTHGRRVGEVMTHGVVSVGPEASLAEIVALMDSRHIRRILVIDGGELKGVVSRADLVRTLAQLIPTVSSEQGRIAVADAELRRRILARISAQSWAPRACVDAKVANGVVELCGVITDQREREALRVLAENTPGVSNVRDSLLWIDPRVGIVLDVPGPTVRQSAAPPHGSG